MSFDQIMAVVLSIYAVALAAVLSLQIVGASIFDARRVKARRQRLAHPHQAIYRSRPLITVIVLSNNHAESIERCLNNLRLSSYRKLQVLIIDNASSDDSQSIVRAYLKEHPKFQARLIAKRKTVGWSQAAQQAWRTYGNGELITIISADSYLEKAALRQMVDFSQDQPDVEMLIPHMQPADSLSISQLVQTYLAMLSQRARKTTSLLQNHITTRAVTVRQASLKSVLKASLDNRYSITLPKGTRSSYVPDAIICANEPTFQQSFRWPKTLGQAFGSVFGAGQAIVNLLTPIVITYFVYVALKLHEPAFLLLSLAGLSLLMLFAVWENQNLKWRQRLAYTAGIPLTYGWLFIRSWTKLNPL